MRVIKVRADGPPQGRWMALARWWWLRNMGPLAPGLGVYHVDHDRLNDDPHNYAVMTPGDYITTKHLDDPAWSERTHRAAALATGAANRDRSAVERARRYLPASWYAVDLARGVVINRPHRKRWMVWGVPVAGNGRGNMARLFGVPEAKQSTEAAIVAALPADRTAISGRELGRRVDELYARHGLRGPASLYQYTWALRRRGWIAVRRQGQHGAVYARTGQCPEVRPPTPIVACRGGQIEERFPGFTRVDDEVRREVA
jgi:hypothetical protein